MGKNRFVAPETVRLELSEGDWIEVKARLTYGERARLSSSSFKAGHIGSDAIDLDFEAYALARLETWLVDWSFLGANGKVVPVSRTAIRNLDPDTSDEIDAALTAHIEALEKKA